MALRQAQAISIHAPRVGCDSGRLQIRAFTDKFQSTHPVWGATIRAHVANYLTRISIHAPRVGCDKKFGACFPVWL